MKAFTKGGAIYNPEKKKKAEEDHKFLQKWHRPGMVLFRRRMQ